MKTRISHFHRGRRIELIVDDGTKGMERKVLASMSHMEATGAWMRTDIRLHRHQRPSAFSGGLSGTDVYCSITPANEDEARYVRSLLRDFVEENGVIRWSTFEGLVKGTPREGGVFLADINHVGFFTKKEGLAYLAEVQTWWTSFEGSFADAKIDNPNRQLSETLVSARLFAKREGVELKEF